MLAKTCSSFLLAALIGAPAIAQTATSIRVVTPAQFATIAVPTFAKPLAIHSKNPNPPGPDRITIYFRGPCSDPKQFTLGGRGIAWKHSEKRYVSFTWCGDGSPFSIQAMNDSPRSTIVDAMERLKRGPLIDTDGRSFTFPQFQTANRIQVEYWSAPKLVDSWWGKRGPGSGPSIISADAIAQTAAAQFAGSPALSIASGMGMVSRAGSSVTYNMGFGKTVFNFGVRNVKCIRAKSGTSCSYELRSVNDAHSFGVRTASLTGDWLRRTDVFIQSPNGLRSASLSTYMSGWAAQAFRNRSSRPQGESVDERSNRQRDCVANGVELGLPTVCPY